MQRSRAHTWRRNPGRLSFALLAVACSPETTRLAVKEQPLLYGADAQKVVSPEVREYQQLGYSMAMSGDLAVAGTLVGSAFAFQRTGATWSALSWIFPDDAKENDLFALSSALSGDTALFGAPGVDTATASDAGAAYVYVRVPGGMKFNRQAKLFADDATANAGFGRRVALDRDTAVVVAAKPSGFANCDVYVFTRSGATWTQQQKILPAALPADSSYGNAVVVQNDTLVVGARTEPGGGAAYVFVRSGATWTLQQRLSSAESNAWFGGSLALDGDSVLVGSPASRGSGTTRTGTAYVFTRSAGTWTLQQRLDPSDGTEGLRYGEAAALRGDTAVVGTFVAGAFAGALYVSTRTAGKWTEQGILRASDSAPDATYASAVELAGDRLAVSSPTATVSGQKSAGALYFYRLAPTLKAAEKCALNSDCESKYCADGVCCDRACAGPCESCLAMFKVSGADGTCGPVKPDTDPRDKCAPATGSCAADGMCDGAGACRSFAGAGTACGPTSCTEGQFKGMICKGDSAMCVEEQRACEPYVCVGNSCASRCSTSAECASKYRCVDGKCVPGESRCSDDGSKAINLTTSLETLCAPLRCDEATGACRGACTSEADCLRGYRCSSAGQCVQLPAAEGDSGCGYARNRREGGAVIVAAIIALALRRRRGIA